MKISGQTSHSIRPPLKLAFDQMSRFSISKYPYRFSVPIQRPLPLFPSHLGRGEYVLFGYQSSSPLMWEGSGGGEMFSLLLPPPPPPPSKAYNVPHLYWTRGV